jgi:hypothetical protein
MNSPFQRMHFFVVGLRADTHDPSELVELTIEGSTVGKGWPVYL